MMSTRPLYTLICLTLLSSAGASVAAPATVKARTKGSKPGQVRRVQAPRETPIETVDNSSLSLNDNDDISLSATVRAKEVKFSEVGHPRVTFSGSPDRETEWTAPRTNLPKPIQPNVIYKNVRVDLKIRSRFKNEARKNESSNQPDSSGDASKLSRDGIVPTDQLVAPSDQNSSKTDRPE